MEVSVRWQILIAAAFVLLAAFFKWVLNSVQKLRCLPPGPWGLPLLGYAPWLGRKPFQTFMEFAKKYGNVFSVTLGSETVVVLNDWLSVKETLVNQPKIFSGRPRMFLFRTLSNGKDLATQDGEVWKKQRNLTMHILRTMGVGKKSMESRAMEMVHDVLETFNQADGKILPMESVVFFPILKVNWNLISSDDVEHSIDLKAFEKIFLKLFVCLRNDEMVSTLPFLRFFPPDGFGFWKTKKLNDVLVSYLKKVVDDHVAKFNEGTLNDFVDYYLAEINKQKKENNKVEPPYTIEHLIYNLWDLFLAGVDTTNSTCLWGFLFLAHNPLFQKKVQEELDRVVGRHRLPTLNDIPQLPLVDALVMEIHRKSSVIVFSLPHRNTETVKLSGFKIPRNTTFIQHIYGVHHDPAVWDQPEAFRPERFIDGDNKAKAPPYLMPFSIGPRLCPGVALAEMELRLLFSCALHQFDFSIPQDYPLRSLEPCMGLAMKPEPYELYISKRIN